MKYSSLALLLCTFSLAPSFASASNARNIPDLPPDADSYSYLRQMTAGLIASDAQDGLGNVVTFGERNLRWLEHINSFLPKGKKISLTSKDTQRGIPIDRPNEYNPSLIQERLANVRAGYPEAMAKIVFEGAPFTNEPPVKLEDYVNWSRDLDRVFQSALRWRMMAPWLYSLAARRHDDLRGWYFLSRLEGRAEKLRTFESLSHEEQTRLRVWLAGMCFNQDRGDSPNACLAEVDREIAAKHDLEAYYQSKASSSSAIFRSYFEIPSYATRDEVRWSSTGAPRLDAPFLDPGAPEVRAFLKDNIEDEWRFGDWKLEISFSSSGALPRVVFEPGATPHVNGLGGDTITMNAQQPLTEYDAQWTIRHEYGHVLGFPDCYVEFYERERNVIVNYQFDIDNLMCSRRGHIQLPHVHELERVYSRKNAL